MTPTMVIDESCGAFRNLPEEALAPDAIQRMVIGEDAALRTLTAEQAAAELGDVFARTLLLRGRFPRTAGEVLAFFAEAGDADGSVGEPSFFLVGDGSQIAMTPDTAGVARNLRFLVALGGGPEGPDVLLSTLSRPRRSRGHGLGPGTGRLQLLPHRRRQLRVGVRGKLPARAERPHPGKGTLRESHVGQLPHEGAALAVDPLGLPGSADLPLGVRWPAARVVRP
ncbi:MAG: hypothetical protein WD794_02535 [Mycobacteriales bacterium]